MKYVVQDKRTYVRTLFTYQATRVQTESRAGKPVLVGVKVKNGIRRPWMVLVDGSGHPLDQTGAIS